MPLISFLTPCDGGKTSPLTSHHGLLQYRKWYWYSHHLQQQRVFSLPVTMFGDQQHYALEDYVEAALMLRVSAVSALYGMIGLYYCISLGTTL